MKSGDISDQISLGIFPLSYFKSANFRSSAKQHCIAIRKTTVVLLWRLKYPEQLKLSSMLWTRAAVCQLVKEKYDITITQRNMSEYLKRWGMTCQRPTKKAYFQDNVKLNQFMHETYPKFIDFLERLIHEADRKVLFIVDNLKVHHGKKVKEWLEKHISEIKPFFTSPYSPEINPDEYLND